MNQTINQDHSYQEYRIIYAPGPLMEQAGPSSNVESIEPNKYKQDFKWTTNETKMLIDLYGTFKNSLGTLEFKSFKAIWEKIARILNENQIPVTPSNCQNRWRVLERNYKKFIDNNNKTGRGRKCFEYQKEMEEIFQNKRNVHPEILLNSSAVDENLEMAIEEEATTVPMENMELNNNERTNVGRTRIKKTDVVKKRSSIMEKMRLDRKVYQEKRLQIETEKLKAIQKRNQLIERRTLLMKKNCTNCLLRQ